MIQPNSFKSSGNIGDTWAALPAIKTYSEREGRKVFLYLVNGQRANYYEGATHPTKDEEGEEVQLNMDMINMMIPLLKEQPYIEDVRVYNDEDVLCDLDMIRHTYVGMPNFSIQRWYFYVFANLACDLSKDWMTVPDTDKDFAKGKILINRTERYNNPKIDYSFLKPFEDDCLFIGTMREYNNFTMNFDLNIRKVHIDNFLEYAQAVKQSKFYMSNQSQGFQIAEAIHHPRILELCQFAPNVIINGANGYDFFGQVQLEYYFHTLNGNEKAYLDSFKKPNK